MRSVCYVMYQYFVLWAIYYVFYQVYQLHEPKLYSPDDCQYGPTIPICTMTVFEVELLMSGHYAIMV